MNLDGRVAAVRLLRQGEAPEMEGRDRNLTLRIIITLKIAQNLLSIKIIQENTKVLRIQRLHN